MKYVIEDLGNVQCRVIDGGWVQFRHKRKAGGFEPWHFIIVGFDETVSGQAGYCNVMRADEAHNRTPIDAQDRILITGRRYGRRHWDH
ncbi:MAG: hypothetical protein ACYC9L_02875 [Sulfuricaulis sp.]